MSGLSNARRAANLTQAQLAAKAGVGQSFISHLEAGRRAPSMDVARQVAAALGTTVDALWGTTADDLLPPTLQTDRPASGE